MAILLTACGPGDAQCDSALDQFNGGEPMTGMEVQMVLNNNFAPDTVGDALQTCIDGGWDGYR